ncbi:MAG: hypothetical protein J6K01_06150 [Paludibacteraceae bacterium]|nr:hypothetical protein [Paludibacteraceae bacterium]
MKKFVFTVLAAAASFAAMAQIDIWCWQDGVATKKAATDSVTLAKPASLGDILVWRKAGKFATSTELTNVDSITFTNPYLENGREYVDLGLTSGTKWATMNLGAENPQDYGSYFAWGETTTKETYSWSTYLDGKISSSYDCGTYHKDALKGVTDIAGTQYDAAKANWGGKWRMPTQAQQTELRNECYWVWTESYNNSNVKGYIVYKAKSESDKGKYVYKNGTPSSSYSLSDAHIFLPAAGYRGDGDLSYVGSRGYFLSSSLNTDYPYYAWDVNFYPDGVYNNFDNRYLGQSVRAVFK